MIELTTAVLFAPTMSLLVLYCKESAFYTFWCFDLAQHKLRYPYCRILRLREIRADLVSQGDAAQRAYRFQIIR